MAKNAQQLEVLFKELDDLIQDSDYEKALKICDKILSIQHGDADAIKCKVICLMKLGQFTEAITAINTSKITDLVFERAYCCYRTKKLNESLTLINSIPNPKPTRALELEAQVLYKMDDYTQCIALYEDLLNTHKSSPELKTNLCAAYIEAGLLKESQSFISKNKGLLQEAYEFAFNAAITFVGIGDFGTAITHLQSAKRACVKTLKQEGYSDEEITEELAVIDIQMGYCLQMSSNNDRAQKLYTDTLKSKPSDAAVVAVASNNLVGLKKNHDLFDSLKKLKSATSEAVEHKLSSVQKKAIGFNKSLLLLHMGKLAEARELLQQLQQQFPTNDESFTLINASLLIKEKKNDEAATLLQQYCAAHPEQVRAGLSLAQMYLLRGDIGKVLSTLESATASLLHTPGVVATRVALYEKLGDIEGALQCFVASISFYEQQSKKSGVVNPNDNSADDTCIKIQRASADFKLKHKKYELAAETYENLLKNDRNDMLSLPSLVIAASHFNPALAEQYESRIPTVGESISVDVDSLEDLPAPRFTGKDSVVNVGEEKGSKKKEKDGDEGKKKKKKKALLPKHYNPSIPPDPERWLPKWQRSYFKKKQRKGVVGKGPQGLSLPQASSVLAATPSTTTTKSRGPVATQAQVKQAVKNATAKKKGKK